MRLQKIEGIVVSERAYGETSKIIQILTKENGLIGVMAKGARKLKSDLRIGSCKMIHGFFYLYYKENGLSTLTAVDILNSYKNIGKDIICLGYASFLLELAEQVMRQNEQEEIFSLLIMTLEKIDEGFDPILLSDILELKYLSFLGVMPVLDACSICGSKQNIVTLSSDRGGLVCSDCRTNEIVVDTKTIKLIRLLYYVDIKKISKTEVKHSVKKEISTFLDQYYDRYTGLFLKSKYFLQNLNRIELKNQ